MVVVGSPLGPAIPLATGLDDSARLEFPQIEGTLCPFGQLLVTPKIRVP